jgi:hypothetical protein
MAYKERECECCGTKENLMHPTGKLNTLCSRCSLFHKDLMGKIRNLNQQIERVKFRESKDN